MSAPGRRPDLTTPCQLDANSIYTVLLVDRGGALKAELLTDSAGSKVVPSGGVNAGYGGTADRGRRRPGGAGRRPDRGRGRGAGPGRPAAPRAELRPWSIAPAARPPGPTRRSEPGRSAPARPRPVALTSGRPARGPGRWPSARWPCSPCCTWWPRWASCSCSPRCRRTWTCRPGRGRRDRPAARGTRRPPGRPPQAAPAPPGARAVAAGHRAGHPEAGHPPDLLELGVDAAGALQPPVRARRGRLVHRAPPRPGEQGPTVIAGHVDSTHRPRRLLRAEGPGPRRPGRGRAAPTGGPPPTG